jgi:hypothetical protein
MKQIVLIVIVAVVGIFLFKASVLLWRVCQGIRFARQSVPFEA